MISLDAYRLSIGSFNNSSLQLNLRTICRGLKIGISLSSKGVSQLLKPTRFMTLFVLTAILLTCGDIESNPGPTFSISTLKGSSHQGNSKYGRTAGTQCVCNSLASLCYSKIILPRYWTTNDIDSVLTFGNSEYSRLGYVHEYLSFDDIPATFYMGEHVMELNKSERSSGYLSRESENFIQFFPPFTSGLFISSGLTTCFMYQSNKVYIFDPHSRDENGFASPDGTAVLLKFDSLSKASDYLKYFFLHRFDHPNYSVGYEYQLFNIEPSQLAIDSIKLSHQKYIRANNSKKRVLKYRGNMSQEKKVIVLSSGKQRMSNLRTNFTPEKKLIEFSSARKRMADFRVNIGPVKAARHKLSEKERIRMMPVRKVLFKDLEIKSNVTPSRIKRLKPKF